MAKQFYADSTLLCKHVLVQLVMKGETKDLVFGLAIWVGGWVGRGGN